MNLLQAELAKKIAYWFQRCYELVSLDWLFVTVENVSEVGNVFMLFLLLDRSTVNPPPFMNQKMSSGQKLVRLLSNLIGKPEIIEFDW